MTIEYKFDNLPLGLFQTYTANKLSHLLPVEHSLNFLSCSLIAEDNIRTLSDKMSLTCGYSLLVLDDCDLGDDSIINFVKNLSQEINNKPEIKSSGIIILITSTIGARNINKLVGETIRNGDMFESLTKDDIEAVMVEDQQMMEVYQSFYQLSFATNFVFASIPFLPLTSDSVARCAQRVGKEQGVKLSGGQVASLMEMQQLVTIKNVRISNSGCKLISSRIDIILGSRNSEL